MSSRTSQLLPSLFFPGLCNWVACLFLFGGTERAQGRGQEAWVPVPTLQPQRRLEWRKQRLICITPRTEKPEARRDVAADAGCHILFLVQQGIPVQCPFHAVLLLASPSDSSFLGKGLLILLILGFPLCTRKGWKQIIYTFLSVLMFSGSLAVFLFLAIRVGIHLLMNSV